MALKSILEIDVQDSAFQAFQESFNKYKTALDKMPGAWNDVSKAAAAPNAVYAEMAAVMMAQNEELIKATRNQDRFAAGTATTGRHMSALERSSRGVAGHIATATRSLLSWGTVLTATTGLLGLGGGLFGITRLAEGAGAGRRSAQGLGLSYAEQRAFGNAYGRVVDPGQFLGNINTGLTDVTSTQYRALLGTGMRPQDLSGKDTSQVAADLIPRLKALVDNTQREMLGPMLEARGLTSILSVQDAQRLKATRPEELDEFKAQFEKSRKSFEVDDKTLKGWQDFTVKLNAAGQKIESVLINGLVGLAGPLGHLSDAFSDAAQAFLASPKLKEWITAAGNGLEHFAGYLDSPEFNKDLNAFIKNVGDMADALGKAVTGLKPLVDWLGGSADDPRSLMQRIPGHEGYIPMPGASGGAPKPGVSDQPFSWWNPGSWLHHRAALTPGAYDAIARAEGTYGPNGINYDAVYGGSRPGLSGMTLAEVQALQAGTKGSTAVGGFQVLHGTLGDAMKGLALDPNKTRFTPEVQRQVADWVNQHQGLKAWEGFKAHPDQLRAAQSAMQPAAAVPTGNGGAAAAVDTAASFWGARASNPELRRFVSASSNLDPAQQAWCAAFANAALATQGIRGSGSNLATDFEKWGQGINPRHVQKGDVVVLPRGHGPGEKGGHVGIATGERDGDMIQIIQGNRGHKVDYSWEDPRNVMVRRAKEDRQSSAAGRTHVKIDVANRTGGSAIISTSQLA